MGVIYLVRHAQASFGTENYDRLSELGQRQSEHLGSVLAGRGLAPEVIVTGRMHRHAETARIALQNCAIDHTGRSEVVIEPGFDEFDHLAVLAVPAVQLQFDHLADDPEAAARPAQTFQRIFADATRRWVFEPDGAEYPESFVEFSSRVDQALTQLAAQLGSGSTALVFTSGGPISWAVAQLTGAGAEGWSALNEVTVNTSITKLITGRQGLRLVSFNDHGHVEGQHADLFTYR